MARGIVNGIDYGEFNPETDKNIVKAYNAVNFRKEKALGSSEYVLTDTQKLEHGGSRSLFVVKDIAAGEALTSENIRSIRPGCGLHTMYYEEVLGRKAKHFLKKGTPLAWDLID